MKTLDKEIRNNLETLMNSFEADVIAAGKTSMEETSKVNKEYDEWFFAKDENGISLKDKVNNVKRRCDELKKQINSGTLSLSEELQAIKQLTSSLEWLDEIEKKQNIYIEAGALAPEREVYKKEAMRNVMQKKLEELVEFLEEEIKNCKHKKQALEEFKNQHPNMHFDTDLKNLDNDIKVLNTYLETAQKMAIGGPIFAIEEIKRITQGLNPKDSFAEALFGTYIDGVRKYGKLTKKEIEEMRNRDDQSITDDDEIDNNNDNNGGSGDGDGNGDDNNGGDDDKKDDDTDTIDIDTLELNMEEVPQLPENISQKPEKSWKTYAAVALGIGAAVGTFAAFGVAGASVVMIASGLGRSFIKKKERDIAADEKVLQGMVNKIEEHNNENQQITAAISQLVERYNNSTDSDFKSQVKAEIERLQNILARNNQAIAGIKTDMETITKRIYPDLKADEYNGPEKITSINDAKEKIKAKGRKLKAYLGSKEGLRDARWFMNSAQITSAGLMLGNFVYGLANANVAGPAGIEPPAEEIITPTGGEAVMDVVPEAGIYDGIGVGESVGGYNLSVGHDTAAWALDGTNAETLISKYVNATDSIFKGFRIQSGASTVPLDLNGMNLTEFLKVNPSIDPSTIVADIASKDGLSQAWVSIDELVSGLGGKSL